MNLHRIIGFVYRKTEARIRPVLFGREKKYVLKRYPHLQATMEAFEKHYIRVEYGAHDRSLMERIGRKMTEQDEYVYGSTPWSAFVKITDRLQLGAEDCFIEPGCGTGHLCFFMSQVFGMRALGFEVIANFVETGLQIKEELLNNPDNKPNTIKNLRKLSLYNLDFFTSDFSHGSVFYVAGTCFPEAYRKRLIEKIHQEGQERCTLITLTHEIEHPGFELITEIEAVFSWGRDRALIYCKKPHGSR